MGKETRGLSELDDSADLMVGRAKPKRLGRPPGVKEKRPRKRGPRLSLEVRRARRVERRAAAMGLVPVPEVQGEVVRVEPVGMPAVVEQGGRATALQVALEDQGVTPDAVVQVVSRALTAKLRRRAGGGEYELADDHEVQLRAADQAKELMARAGVIPAKAEDAPRKSTVVLVRIDKGGGMAAVEVRS